MAEQSDGPIFSAEGVGLELWHQTQRRPIIEGINIEINRGEFFTIVGASGTGKTTLLRILGGLQKVTSGTVRFRGIQVTEPPEGAVVVFQDYSHALLQWRSVARNVALGLEGCLDAMAIDERVREALQMVDLARNASDYPWQLSGGMQQRVQIARALALRPDALLMDEPFGALDAMTKATLQDEVLRIHAHTGTSFVFITHDIDEAVYLGDRIAVLGGPPGRLHKIIDVNLPRPRDQIETRRRPDFLRYRLEVHAAIMDARRG
jgi:NitT/TauT family transport system ATP-binding protein